jgi:CRISPR/Cas system CSM-associated protein Csm3 (group 7 of RAMP superfamily)
MGDVLHLVRATIEALSPLSSGSGDDGMFDVALVRDANGLLEIAASSIQGVFRHLYEDRFGRENTEALFGFADGDSGSAGRLFFSFARVHGSNDVAVTGLCVSETPGALSDELLRRLAADAPLVRDHVALNHRHVAAGRGKFERVAVPRGTRFSFEIAMWGANGEEEKAADDKVLRDLLSLMQHPAFRLGGAARRGYGRVSLIAAGTATMPLSDPAAIRDTRKRPASDLSGFTRIDVARDLTPAGGDAVTIALSLTPMGLWRFGSTGLALRSGEHELRGSEWIDAQRSGPDVRRKDVDAASVREPAIDWSGNQGHWREPQRTSDRTAKPRITLAGTAIKGPLAHRTLFHWNRLHPGGGVAMAGRMIDPSAWEGQDPARRKAFIAEIATSKLRDGSADEPPWTARPTELESLFGAVKEQDNEPAAGAGEANGRSRGSAARLIVDDTDIEVESNDIVALDHNSIDRFTGGVRNRLLYAEEVAIGGVIAVTITVLPPRDMDGMLQPNDGRPETLVRLAFCHALRDLCEGRLALGAKSLGFCTAATPTFQGAGAEGWKTAWDEAGRARATGR